MKPLSLSTIPILNRQFHKYFPQARLDALWRQVQPKAYPYLIGAAALLSSLWLAWLSRASGLRAIAERRCQALGSANFSSLSHALARPVFAAFAQAVFGVLAAAPGALAEGTLVAVDSMCLALAASCRHGCQKINDKCAGGGAIWAWRIDGGARGGCPVQVLRLVAGAWHDAAQLRTLALVARGPLYLLDRGFYALDLMASWLLQQVHFIVRVRVRSFVYEPLLWLGPKRRLGTTRIEFDGLAQLGGPQAKHHPLVRLVWARLGSGELLVLASDQWLFSAEQILERYQRRWQIERFHKLLKDALGLAHLYSFAQRGLEAQLWGVLTLAVLLFLGEPAEADEMAVTVIRRALRAARARLGLDTPWRRNCCTVTHAKKKKTKQVKANTK
jgi:hypothetical protein